MRILQLISIACLSLFGCADDDAPQAATTPTGKSDVVAPPGPVRRNVLLIIADDMGIEMVAAYGPSGPWHDDETAFDPNVRTPTLTRLAQAGVLFSRAWSSPVCSPTRAGIYTGTYASRNGIGTTVSGDEGLAPSWKTIPELAAPRVVSGLFGKWHLGEKLPKQPAAQGFARHAGVLEGGVEDYFDWAKTVDGASAGTSVAFAGGEMREDAGAWIASQTGPWFAVLATVQPHATKYKTFQRPPANCYKTDPALFSADGATVSLDLALYDEAGEGLAEGDAAIPLYKANVECLDTQIGRLIDTIDGLPDDVLERTTIIFIGDNGTPGEVIEGYLDSQGKGTLFEGGIHVPVIIADGYVLVHGVERPINLTNPDPGRIASPGRTEDALVQTVDLFATILQILDVPLPRNADSISMYPYLQSLEETYPDERTYVFSEFFKDDYAGAIRDDRYKLIYDEDDACYALFDLSEPDPQVAETANLIPRGAPLDASLAARMEALRDQANAFLSATGSPHVFPESAKACPSTFDGH